MKELEKFNAETTPLGTELITRDGMEVTEWYYFKTADNKYPVRAVVNRELLGFTIDGRYYNSDNESDNDLFIKPKVKECWVNVCINNKGELDISGIYPSYTWALNNRVRGIDYIKTIRITDEPE